MITGNYKAKNPSARSGKSLVIIQFKLEEETIKRHPEYKMESLWLDKLAKKLKNKDTQDLNDTHFPTFLDGVFFF